MIRDMLLGGARASNREENFDRWRPATESSRTKAEGQRQKHGSGE
jgi:hypothetical protein